MCSYRFAVWRAEDPERVAEFIRRRSERALTNRYRSGMTARPRGDRSPEWRAAMRELRGRLMSEFMSDQLMNGATVLKIRELLAMVPEGAAGT
jgi:hypothetical protein